MKQHRRLALSLWALGAVGFLAPLPAPGATTKLARDDSFDVLQKGEFEGVALSSDGFLFPSYKREEVGDTGAEIVWGALEIGRGRLLAITGHEGKLVRLGGNGEPEILHDLPEPELTAMTRLDDGSVLIAAAPSGRIYRLGTDDTLTTLTTLEAKFIWDLEVDTEGNVWAATGTEGKLYKITLGRDGAEAELAWDSPSQNLIDLWIDAEGVMGEEGALYLAGQNPGWLYRYEDGAEEGEAIFDAGSDEIRAIHPWGGGIVLATNTERAPTPQVLNLTLRLSGVAVSGTSTPTGGSSSSSSRSANADRGMGDVFSSAGRKPPTGARSAIVALSAEGFSREVWVVPERPIHSIASAPNGGLLIAAGGKGRLFELDSNEKFALVADLKEDYVVRIVPTEDGWLLAAARNGLLFAMDRARTEKAIYRSRILDAKTPVRWGRFYWRGQNNNGRGVSVAFRKGNTTDPEKGGWGDWSNDERIDNDKGVNIPRGPARFLQYRLTLEQGRNAEPLLKTDYVEAFYQQPNRAPRVRSITVSDAAAPRAGRSSSSSTSTSTPRPSSSSSSSRPPTGRSGSSREPEPQGGGREAHSNSRNINVVWQAEDPNGDKMMYALYFKADDEDEWKLIDDELSATRLPLGVSGVGDGRYRFRVVATDEFVNPPGDGLNAELTSEEVIIDNTPPAIVNLRVRTDGPRARIRFKAVDELSLISSILIDFDGGDTYPLFPTDGFYDQIDEEIDWTSLRLEDGEHVVTIAVTDRRGNTTVDKAVFRIGR